MGFNSGIRLRKIKSPTLIMHGKEDIMVPPANAEFLAKKIPNAKLVMLDNAGHFLFQPDPEKAINTINNFLTEEIVLKAQ